MPTLDYTTGDGTTYDDNEIINDMKSKGYPIVGQTADGLNAVVQKPNPGKDEEPTFHIPLQKYLENQGEKVSGIKPQNPGTDNISPWLSTGAQKFDDPNMKKFYVQDALHRAHGLQNAQVIGSGNDLHVWDPEASKWQQITENPKWNNKTGWMSAALAVPHLVGMGSGGATGLSIGAPAGALAGGPGGGVIGGLLGAGGGAALGSSLAEALTERGMGAMDPSFEETLNKYPGQAMENIGSIGGEDALAETGGRALGLGFKALGPNGRKEIVRLAEEGKNIFSPMAAPVSKLAQATGSGLEAVGGGLAGGLGKFADSPWAPELAGQFVPGVGKGVQLGESLSAPSAAIRGAAKIAQKIPEWPLTRNLFKNSAEDIGNWGRRVSEETLPSNLADKINRGVEDVAETMGRPTTRQASAKQVLHNVVNRVNNKAVAEEAWAADPIEQALAKDQASADRTLWEHPDSGLGPGDLDRLSEESIGGMKQNYVEDYLRNTAKKPNWGTTVGGVSDKLGGIGDAVRGGVSGSLRVGARLGQIPSAAAAVGGFGLRNAGTLAEPLELPASLRYGIPSLDDWWREHNR